MINFGRAKTSSGCGSHVAVITGAGGDLGRELAIRLSRGGRPVALVDLDHDRLDTTVNACLRSSEQVKSWVADVTQLDDVTSLAEAVRNTLGPAHALYNVAGVIHAGLLVDSQAEDLERVVAVDLVGTMTCSRAFVPQLVDCGHGELINISSAFGLIGVAGYTAYSAAKFGVRGFSEALQQELRDTSVTVSAVYPGGVRTGIMRRGTYGDSADAQRIQESFERSVARLSSAEAADRIVRAVDRGKQRILVGADAQLVNVLSRVAGTGYQRVTRTMGLRQHPDKGDVHVPQVAPD